MPHYVRKRHGKGFNWVIVRRNRNGSTTTVGHSRSKRKAKISASIRDRASGDQGRQ